MKKTIKVISVLLILMLIAACSGVKETELKLGQVLGAPHGTKSYSVTTVVVEGDKIVLAHIDEYQYLKNDAYEGVPNSDAFAEAGSVAEGFVLGSKRVNNTPYSENMKKAGSTVSISDNYNAIQEFVIGKTVSELEELAKKPADDVIDAVTSATLVDTPNYLTEIIKAAK